MLQLIIFGMLIGVVLGLTGAGGGILAIPALILVLGYNVTDAIPVALMAVAVAATLGAIDGLRKRQVRYRAALLMAGFGMVLAPVGIWISHRLPHDLLITLFSLMMMWVAWRMISQAKSDILLDSSPDYLEQNCMLNPSSGRLRWNAKCAATLAATGSVSGLFSGMLGVGGGFLITPALKQFSNVSMHGIVATSLMVVALISIVTATIAVLSGAHITSDGWLFVVCAAIGLSIGRLSAPHVSARRLQGGFGVVTAIVAAILLWQVAT